ncbi:MAG: CRISPR-associated endoribonuclease Cas6 [Thermoproteota archaeon]
MRILLELESEKNFSYDMKYYHKLQGFIYSLLKDTEFSLLHDKKGYKFFSFSNIFPLPKDKRRMIINAGENKKLIIASPNELFIKILEEKLRIIRDSKKTINIGEAQFSLENLKIFSVSLGKSSVLRSMTPIVVRIPEKNYEKYGIPSEFRKKRYVYWRPQYSFEAFIKQLEENLVKKFNEFYSTNLEIENVFELFEFKKSVVSHAIISGEEQKIVGSIWDFIFTHLSEEQKKLLEFGVDCGFGERNSLGFGFMNVVKVRK